MEYFRQRFINELNDEGAVIVRSFEWPPADVLQTMAPHDYDAHFVEWVGRIKQEAKDRAQEFLADYGCLDRFNRLEAQLRNQSVIPFVGAGLSKPMGFPLWRNFLEGLTADYPAAEGDLLAHLDAYRYEEAAQLMYDRMGADVFAEAIQNTFGSRHKALNGPVVLLPNIFTVGAITTNFDYVLNRVFDEAEHPFKDEFMGARLREAPRRLANESHCLIRLHGEADTEIDRVLSLNEYKEAYGEDGNYHAVIRALITNNSLLFLGCSLSVDRLFQALRDIKAEAQVATPRHYAFLPFDPGMDREARRAELGSADIHPIWYPPDDHDQAIEDLLISLLEGGFHG